jgi:DNA processing protein
MERDELAAWLRLAQTPGVGRAGARRLLAAFGLPQQLFTQPNDALAAVVGAAQARALQAEPPDWAAQVERTWAWLQEAPAGTVRRVLTLADPDFPPALLQTEDPPLMLYASGMVPAGWPRAIAVVGSRNPTPQGLIDARQFARSFAEAGWTVVSGLALGIDAAAHEGALEGAAAGEVATIAVVGTGLDRVYPRRNLELAHRIVDRGLVLSEQPLGMGPLAENFPQRNRLIAALGQGTLVVEAALQSGSLITARQAAEQGKEVFAIPGSIHSVQSRGCHALLKQGAKLVETAQDVLEDLAPGSLRPAAPASSPAPVPPLLEALGFEPVGIDALVARTGIAASELQARLLELELEGRVARLPGGLFQRIERS